MPTIEHASEQSSTNTPTRSRTPRAKGYRVSEKRPDLRALLAPHGVHVATTRHLFGAPIGHGTAIEFSLESYVNQIWDQGWAGSCVGHADGKLIEMRCAIQGTPIEKPSVTGAYAGALALERAATLPQDWKEGDPLPKLEDSGCDPHFALLGLVRFGIANDQDWPAGGYDPDKVTSEPSQEQLELATATHVQGFYEIKSEGDGRLADIRQSISEGYPVVFGTQVDKAFEDYDGGAKTKLPGYPNENELEGGHMLLACGYREDGCFRVVNSWGTGWGNNGLVWVRPEFLTNPYVSDIAVLQVAAGARPGSKKAKVTT